MANKTVKTVDIQMLDETRANATTIKLDNPREDLTRENISSAMQTPFANGWFLCNNGSVAKYLGDTILNTSIKVSLEGEDFYVTPNELSLSGTTPKTLTIAGAQVQGYNIKNIVSSGSSPITSKDISVNIADNGLTVNVALERSGGGNGRFNLILIILGQEINIPCTFS